MMRLVDSRYQYTSPEFDALRDRADLAPMRQLADRMWALYEPYADPDFPEQFALQVHPRFWEMYLALRLLDSGLTLVPKTQTAGPDIHARFGKTDLWIEATAPNEGQGQDAVPSIYEHHGWDPVPEDKIILRYTNAIAEKKTKHDRYLADGLVHPSDPFVVAINGGAISMTRFEGSLPAIIRSVFPVGDFSVTIDTNTLETVQAGYRTRFLVLKKSGAPVPTNSFLDPGYGGVSAILFSNAALWDMPSIPGEEFLCVHNFYATAPLQRHWLPVGKSCWREENHLSIMSHASCA